MAIRITITKPLVTDQYGIIMNVGQIYSVDRTFGQSIVQQGRASDTDNALTSPNPIAPPDIVWLSPGEIATPTTQELNRPNIIYKSNVAPYQEYKSNGTTLVPLPQFKLDSLNNPIGTNVGTKTINSLNSKRFRAITLGDSHVALGQKNAGTINSIVVANGIMTVVLASSCQTYAGNYVSLYYSLDTGFTNPINGANQKILIMSADFLTFTISATTPLGTMPDGNYTSQVAQWAIYLANTNTTDWSLYRWLNAFMGGKFSLVANYAYGGSLSGMAVGFLPQINAGVDFDYVFLCTGTNNINNNASTIALAIAAADTAYNDIVTITSNLTGLGKVVMLQLPAPFNSAAGGVLQSKNIAAAYLRNRLLDLAKSNSLIEVLDTYGNNVNGLYPTGGADYGVANSFESATGVHLSTRGIFATIRQLLANGFNNVTKLIPTSPVTQLDSTSYAQPELTANIWTNSGFIGTAAIVATGWSGTAPTSLRNFGATATSANVGTGQATRYTQPNTNSANQGYAFQVDSTWTSATESFTFASADISSQVVTGNWYKASIDITITAQSSTNLLSGVQLSVFLNGITNYAFQWFGNTIENGLPFVVGDVLTISTEPFFIPVGTALGGGVLIIPQINNRNTAGTTSIQFSSPQMRIVADPRI